MSAEVREALAAAASTVAGVNVTPYYRAVSRAGQGFVERLGTTYPNPFGGVVTWRVQVLGPQDPAQSEKWLDEIGPAVRAAVAGELRIERMTPGGLPTDSGLMPCVVVEGTREEE